MTKDSISSLVQVFRPAFTTPSFDNFPPILSGYPEKVPTRKKYPAPYHPGFPGAVFRERRGIVQPDPDFSRVRGLVEPRSTRARVEPYPVRVGPVSRKSDFLPMNQDLRGGGFDGRGGAGRH